MTLLNHLKEAGIALGAFTLSIACCTIPVLEEYTNYYNIYTKQALEELRKIYAETRAIKEKTAYEAKLTEIYTK